MSSSSLTPALSMVKLLLWFQVFKRKEEKNLVNFCSKMQNYFMSIVVAMSISRLGLLSCCQFDILALILNINVNVWMIDATVLFIIAQEYRVDVTFV